MKRIRRKNLSQSKVYKLEDNAEKISIQVMNKYKPYFDVKNFGLEILISRMNNNPKFDSLPSMDREQYLEPFYYSAIDFYLFDSNGQWVFLQQEENEDFGFHFPLWSVRRNFLSFFIDSAFLGRAKYYITEYTMEDLEKALVNHIKYCAVKFNIPLN